MVNPSQVTVTSKRLKLFTGLAYFVGGLTLIWSGYVILYADQPTFGDHPTDYLTLFTWGLGGQTAFSTVANRLITWGLDRQEAGGLRNSGGTSS